MLADTTGLLLDGGKATRLGGRHKAFLEVGGQPLARRSVELFRGLFAEILVATSRPGPWAPLGVRLVQDPVPDAGPLSGIAAGLAGARTPLVFVAAGDMPSLSAAVIENLVMRARLLPGHAVVPIRQGRPEPLHAVYPARLAEQVHRVLLAGVRAPRELLATVPVTWVDADELAALPGASATFRNLNTPEDVAAAEANP